MHSGSVALKAAEVGPPRSHLLAAQEELLGFIWISYLQTGLTLWLPSPRPSKVCKTRSHQSVCTEPGPLNATLIRTDIVFVVSPVSRRMATPRVAVAEQVSLRLA